jgi:hypothetical protein
MATVIVTLLKEVLEELYSYDKGHTGKSKGEVTDLSTNPKVSLTHPFQTWS